MHDKNFWNEKYLSGETGWDIGYVSTPLKEYFDQLTNKDLRILIPGAGNGYEVLYLYEIGFRNIFLLDISNVAIEHFISCNPDFPKDHILLENIFEHHGNYDLIIEQTLFCTISPNLRDEYARKIYELLNEKGKFVGLLFDDPLNKDEPPYGGSKLEYEKIFEKYFRTKKFELCYNSIKPREDRELFFILEKIGTQNF